MFITLCTSKNHSQKKYQSKHQPTTNNRLSIKAVLQEARQLKKTLCCCNCTSTTPDVTLKPETTSNEIVRLCEQLRTADSKCHKIKLHFLECWESRHSISDAMLLKLFSYQMDIYKPATTTEKPTLFFTHRADKPEKNKYTCQLMKILWVRHNRARYNIQSAEKKSALERLEQIFLTFTRDLYEFYLDQNIKNPEKAASLFIDTMSPKTSTIEQSAIMKNLYGIRKKPNSNQHTFSLIHLEALMTKYFSITEDSHLLPAFMMPIKPEKLPEVLKVEKTPTDQTPKIGYRILKSIKEFPETTDQKEAVVSEYTMQPSRAKLKKIEGVVGFPRDYGNLTCFVNATLKALFAVINDRILNEIKTMPFDKNSMEENIQKSFLKLYELYKSKYPTSAQIRDKKAQAVKSELLQLIKYCSQYGDAKSRLRELFPSSDPSEIPQNDAHEFLALLLSVLYSGKDEKAQTLHSFNAVTRLKLKVSGKTLEKPPRREVGFFLTLPLDNDNKNITIKDLVNKFFIEEDLSEDEWLYPDSDSEREEKTGSPLAGAGAMSIPKFVKYPTTRWQTLEAELSPTPYTSSSSDSDSDSDSESHPIPTKRKPVAKPSVPDSTSRRSQPHNNPFDVICLHISPYTDPSKKVQRGQNLLANFEETVTLPVTNINDPDQKVETMVLRAKSIVCHKGENLHSGHYTALVRSNDRWRLEDDLTTWELTDPTIPEAEAVRHFENGEFYLVFYQPYPGPESDESSQTTPAASPQRPDLSQTSPAPSTTNTG